MPNSIHIIQLSLFFLKKTKVPINDYKDSELMEYLPTCTTEELLHGVHVGSVPIFPIDII